MSDKWNLYDYEVWGNESDGYDVNDCFLIEEGITIVDDAKNDDVVNYLKTIGYFGLKVVTDDIIFFWDDDFIELFLKETGMPLCCLRKSY